MKNFKIIILTLMVSVLGMVSLSSSAQERGAVYSFNSYSSSALTLNPTTDDWDILQPRETFFKVSISETRVVVKDGTNNSTVLDTGLDLVDTVEDIESVTFIFEEANGSGGVIQLLVKREGYRVDNVVALLWVSSRKVGKGIILDLSLPQSKGSPVIYNKGD